MLMSIFSPSYQEERASHPVVQARKLLDTARNATRLFYLWTGVLFIIGALVWGWFFNWGTNLPLETHDWAKITAPRLTYLQNTIRQGELPLHISDREALGGMTDRYMGIPDVMLSPQVLLLNWIDIQPFILINVLLMYAVGFVGLLVFCRRQQIGLLAFTILFLLFNFNGHILAHYAVGHYTWTGYFFFPWLLILIFDLVDGKTGWRWVLYVALINFLMLLQGGYHQFVYSLFLLGLLAAALPQRFSVVLKSLFATVLLSAVRLFPVALNLSGFKERFHYIGGYSTVLDLWYSIVQLSGSSLRRIPVRNEFIGSWEMQLYIGLVAALFIAGFGIARALFNRRKTQSYAILLIPAAGLFILSMDQVFYFLQKVLPFPPLTGERIPARMASLAFLLLLTLAVVEFQRWYEKQTPSLASILGGSGLVLWIGYDLWRNASIWRITGIAKYFEVTPFFPDQWMVAHHGDLKYLAVLFVGLIISLICLAVLIFFTTRQESKDVITKAAA